jgi:hypothetical protein
MMTVEIEQSILANTLRFLRSLRKKGMKKALRKSATHQLIITQIIVLFLRPIGGWNLPCTNLLEG